jgi:hypothetical protein
MRRLKAEQWEWISSEALDYEIQQIPDRIRRLRVRLLMTFVSQSVIVGEAEEQRALELEKMGFHPLDALHLACAESGHADVFFTTDDKLLRLAQRIARQLQLKVQTRSCGSRRGQRNECTNKDTGRDPVARTRGAVARVGAGGYDSFPAAVRDWPGRLYERSTAVVRRSGRAGYRRGDPQGT